MGARIPFASMLPTRDYVDWLFQCADWQVRELQMITTVEEGASIVLPTQDDFPSMPHSKGTRWSRTTSRS